MDEIIDVLDEKTGDIIGNVKKSIAHKKGIWHGSINIIILNEDGTKILLQKRSSQKSFYPNMWDITVGGHITSGETAIEAAKRELYEELGLECENIQKVTVVKESLEDNGIISNEFVTVFLVRKNIDLKTIKLQNDEVSEAKWCTSEDLESLISEYKIIPHVYFDILQQLIVKKV